MAIAALTGLTSLNLWNNQIGDEGAMAIAALKGLTSLNLGHNQISAKGAMAIAALKGLTSLNLSDNQIGDEGAMAIAALKGLTSLDLWDNQIGDKGAMAIAALTGLTSLDLGHNQIGAEGAMAIAALTGLTSLNLGHNQISAKGAMAIAVLTGLTSLNLWDNQIGDEGAMAIAALKGLTSLDLRSNQIGDKGAMAIAALKGLTSLDLRSNQIGDKGAMAIAALKGLTSLYLGKNNIGAEGVTALLDAWSSSEQRSSQLKRLDLTENGDFGGLFVKEVLETTDAQAILAGYRRFTLAKKRETLRPLNELKLLVVGHEAVGKTSLLRYLISDKPRDPNQTKTPGIVQHEKIEVQGWSPHKCQVKLNVWDFGGQEMMRGTHRFFLTQRSLYLLILEDRRQDDRSIYDWLKTIRNRGGDSPIIVVINKSDAGKQDLRLDESGLQLAYPNIVTFLRTSCDPDDWAKGSIKRLREKIVDTATSDRRLKHVQDPIPANWLYIKNRVSQLAGQRSILSHDDFIALCKDRSGSAEPITEDNEQRSLLRLLHELGSIVAHGLERDAPASRREINLLDPNWLTGAVYRIMEMASSVQHEGEFCRSDLLGWLLPTLYPAERHEFILDMMQDRDIGLCFRLPTQREKRFLLPEGLPASRRFVGHWPDDSLRFRYLYNYLPPSLIPRFIVQSHRHLTPDKARWRTGVVLAVRNCEALVLADVDQRRVDIQVTGPPGQRRGALDVILNDLEVVHALNPEAEPVSVVPLPDRSDVHVRYEHLLMLEDRMGRDHSFIPDGADRLYEVAELLDGLPNRGQRPAQQTKPHVVILVHGIRTQALWQNELRKTLENSGFVVQPTNYGYFDVARFLFPWQLFASPVIRKTTKQIRLTLADHKDGDCSIIAHSFGTYVVARTLRDNADLEFKKVIFCGSIVPDSFPLEECRKRFEAPLVNEVGTRDFWPVMAKVITFGYGWPGTYGFRRPPVRDRWHNGRAHSDFLTPEFCRRYWVSCLSGDKWIDDDESADRPPWWLWVVSTFQIKYVLLIVVTALLWRWLI
jgi:small GTP-binding protein